MDTTQKTITNLPISILIAFVITSLLFIGIPLLTRLSVAPAKKDDGHHVLISQNKPPPPPEPEKEEKIEQKKKDVVKKTKKVKVNRPKLNVRLSNLGGNLSGTIEIGSLNAKFDVSDSLFVSAFNLNEVDQRPSILRRVQLRYPFDAKQKGINGKVMLRFVVDSTGNVHEPQVISAEPEGIFEESALEAIARFKFRPAKKGGEAVDCIVKQPLTYDVTD